jgi:hypothetical protein
MGELFQPMHLLIILFVLFFTGPVVVIPYWQIFKKAGFSPVLSILVLLPLVNLLVLYYVAFSDWKRVGGDWPV